MVRYRRGYSKPKRKKFLEERQNIDRVFQPKLSIVYTYQQLRVYAAKKFLPSPLFSCNGIMVHNGEPRKLSKHPHTHRYRIFRTNWSTQRTKHRFAGSKKILLKVPLHLAFRDESMELSRQTLLDLFQRKFGPTNKRIFDDFPRRSENSCYEISTSKEAVPRKRKRLISLDHTLDSRKKLDKYLCCFISTECSEHMQLRGTHDGMSVKNRFSVAKVHRKWNVGEVKTRVELSYARGKHGIIPQEK